MAVSAKISKGSPIYDGYLYTGNACSWGVTPSVVRPTRHRFRTPFDLKTAITRHPPQTAFTSPICGHPILDLGHCMLTVVDARYREYSVHLVGKVIDPSILIARTDFSSSRKLFFILQYRFVFRSFFYFSLCLSGGSSNSSGSSLCLLFSNGTLHCDGGDGLNA